MCDTPTEMPDFPKPTVLQSYVEDGVRWDKYECEVCAFVWQNPRGDERCPPCTRDAALEILRNAAVAPLVKDLIDVLTGTSDMISMAWSEHASGMLGNSPREAADRLELKQKEEENDHAHT